MWLFKQGDLLLGPGPFTQIVEMLYAGEIDGATKLSPTGGEVSWKPLAECAQFTVHLAKAQAKLRVEAHATEKRKVERRSSVVRLAMIVVLVVVALAGAGWGAIWLAIHRPWEKQIQIAEPLIS